MDTIICPHCSNAVVVELHILSKEKGKGPAPYIPGTEITTFIFEKIEEGLSLDKIAQLLNSRNIPAQHGGKWYAASVRRARENVRKQKNKEES